MEPEYYQLEFDLRLYRVIESVLVIYGAGQLIGQLHSSPYFRQITPSGRVAGR